MMQPQDVLQWLDNIVQQPGFAGSYSGPRLADGSCRYFHKKEPCDLFGQLLNALGFTSRDVTEGLSFGAAISHSVRQLLSEDTIELLDTMQFWHDDGMPWLEVLERGKQFAISADFSGIPEPFPEALDVQLLSQA